MSWVQIVLLVLQVLKSLKKSESAEAFADGASGFGIDRELLKKLWENREEILAFVLQLIELFSKKEQPIGSSGNDEIAALISELRA